jgi:RNA polymerase sigma-70 factor (ECF subfamily)
MTDFKAELLPLMPNLRAFARSLCGDSDWADDLVQETILRAWASQATYEPGTNLKAWIFTILRNYFYNELRKRKRSVELHNDRAALEVGVNESQPANLHLQDLGRELQKLAPDQREALMLVSVEGCSYEEAARICDCAVGTVKSRVARARRELENKLGGADVGMTARSGNGVGGSIQVVRTAS